MTEDGLLPAIAEDEFEWLRPQMPEGADNDEKVALVMRWIGDIQNLVNVVWPAEIDGVLQRPPDAHLLDRLVRVSVLEDASPEIQGEVGVRPRAVTVATISELPNCDICGRDGITSIARYDGKMKGERQGWANMCSGCYRAHGTGRLGIGEGQYLITWDEVGPDVRGAFVAAKAYWSGRGVQVPDHLPWD